MLELDGKGWREISKILAATLDKVAETSRNIRARLADSAERPIRATGGLMLFELPPEKAASDYLGPERTEGFLSFTDGASAL